MQSEGNEHASPKPNSRRNQKAPRTSQPNHDTQSDSNLPQMSTPKPRKTQRQLQQGERATSLGVPSKQLPGSASVSRSRPAPGAAATPSKTSYAGAAFHASPAPSSLPVPKFVSKSIPSAHSDVGLQARLEGEANRNNSPAPRWTPTSGQTDGKSALDMFFNADRQEKARLQNGSASELRSETPSKAREMFMLELDEASSPASQHTTPAPIRMQHSLERSRATPENTPVQNPDESRRAAQTQSLKAFLNITSAEAGKASPNSPFIRGQQPQPSYATPSHTQFQQHSDLHYGNRNLSPMFQAAQSSPQRTSQLHQHPPQNSSSDYSSVYANPYASSPSKFVPSNAYNYPNPSQPPVLHAAQSGTPPFSPQSSAQPANSNEIQDMEDRMKRMLRMS